MFNVLLCNKAIHGSVLRGVSPEQYTPRPGRNSLARAPIAAASRGRAGAMGLRVELVAACSGAEPLPVSPLSIEPVALLTFGHTRSLTLIQRRIPRRSPRIAQMTPRGVGVRIHIHTFSALDMAG